MEDRELISRIISEGDTKSFATIVSRYSSMVFAKAMGLVHREELAAEITQQTFILPTGNMLWHSRLACLRSL